MGIAATSSEWPQFLEPMAHLGRSRPSNVFFAFGLSCGSPQRHKTQEDTRREKKRLQKISRKREKELNVFLSPGATPADFRAWCAADNSPIMANFSALVAFPCSSTHALSRCNQPCPITCEEFLETCRGDSTTCVGRRTKSFHPRSCFTTSREYHPDTTSTMAKRTLLFTRP